MKVSLSIRQAGIMAAIFVVAISAALASDTPEGLRESKTGSIPFSTSHNFQCILVAARVNGKKVTLLLDTGSSHTSVSPELINLFDSVPARTPAAGSAFRSRGRWTRTDIELGRQIWLNHIVIVRDDLKDVSRSLGQKVDGILGEDLLGDFKRVTIDYQGHVLELEN